MQKQLKQFSLSLSLQQRYATISLSLVRMSIFTAIYGITLWFDHPIIMCKFPDNDLYQQCQEIQICGKDIDYFIDLDKSSKSLAAQYNLVCEKKTYFLSLIFFGLLLGSLFNLFVKISNTKRTLFLSCITLFQTINGYFLIQQIDLGLIQIQFIIRFFFYQLYYPNSIMTQIDLYNDKLRPSLVLITNISECFIGISYAILSNIMNNDWIFMMKIEMTNYFIVSIFFFLSYINRPQQIFQTSNQNIQDTQLYEPIFKFHFGNVQQIFKIDKNLYDQFIKVLFIMNMFQNTTNSQNMEIASLQGSTLFKISVTQIFQILCNILIGMLILKYNQVKIIASILFLIGLFNALFLKIDPQQINIYHIMPILLSTAFQNILSILFYNSLPMLLDKDLIALLFGIGYFLQRIVGVIVPYINFICLQWFNIQPQFLIGISNLFMAYILAFQVEIDNKIDRNSVDEFCRNISALNRVSFMNSRVLSYLGDSKINTSNNNNNNDMYTSLLQSNIQERVSKRLSKLSIFKQQD